jgi:hypothetical protein
LKLIGDDFLLVEGETSVCDLFNLELLLRGDLLMASILIFSKTDAMSFTSYGELVYEMFESYLLGVYNLELYYYGI